MVHHVPKVVFVAVLAVAASFSNGLGPRLIESGSVSLWYEGVTPEEAHKCLARASEVYNSQPQAFPLRLRLTRQPTGLRLTFENVNFAMVNEEMVGSFKAFATVLAEAIGAADPVDVQLTDGGSGTTRSVGTVVAGEPAAPITEPNTVSAL